MNLRQKVMILGGVLGALIGVGAAYVYLQSTPLEIDEETGEERLPKVQPGDALKAGLGALTVVRQVAGMGQQGKQRQGQ
jgi:hypothetical protein